MQIEKMLVVATNHLPEPIYREIEKFSAMDRMEGDLLYVNNEGFDAELLHENMSQLADLARQKGCCWLLFDCDADPIEDVTTFDW